MPEYTVEIKGKIVDLKTSNKGYEIMVSVKSEVQQHSVDAAKEMMMFTKKKLYTLNHIELDV